MLTASFLFLLFFIFSPQGHEPNTGRSSSQGCSWTKPPGVGREDIQSQKPAMQTLLQSCYLLSHFHLFQELCWINPEKNPSSREKKPPQRTTETRRLEKSSQIPKPTPPIPLLPPSVPQLCGPWAACAPVLLSVRMRIKGSTHAEDHPHLPAQPCFHVSQVGSGAPKPP